MPGPVFKAAWRLADPVIERDAELFWHAARLLPERADVAARLNELCAAAYVNGSLVAVSTAVVRYIETLRCKLAMYRTVVTPEFRNQDVATGITIYSRDLLEQWSKDHPEEEVLGLGAVIHSKVLVETLRNAVYPDSKLAFIGYTQEGYQMRVFWFAHAKLSNYWPGDPRGTQNPEAPA